MYRKTCPSGELAVSKNSKVVYGRPSIKETSWKINGIPCDMLLKVD